MAKLANRLSFVLGAPKRIKRRNRVRDKLFTLSATQVRANEVFRHLERALPLIRDFTEQALSAGNQFASRNAFRLELKAHLRAKGDPLGTASRGALDQVMIHVENEGLVKLPDFSLNASPKTSGNSSKVAGLVAKGFRPAAISKEIGITSSTVSYHLHNLREMRLLSLDSQYLRAAETLRQFANRAASWKHKSIG